MSVIVDGKNHYQLTDKADGTPQSKTEEQRAIDSWPPPEGFSQVKLGSASTRKKPSHA